MNDLFTHYFPNIILIVRYDINNPFTRINLQTCKIWNAFCIEVI